MRDIKKAKTMTERSANRTNAKKTGEKVPALLSLLLRDVFVRYWPVTLLAVFTVFSAILLARTAHDTRRLTAQWEQLRQQQQQQQIAWESLRLEITTLSEPDRIANLAKKQLGMIEVSRANEKVISP